MPRGVYKRPPRKTCTVEGCNTKHFGHGYCGKHYYRWRQHGDPLGGKLEAGVKLEWIHSVALKYDGEDCLAWPFIAKAKFGYGRLRVDGRQWEAHRYICIQAHGNPPSKNHHAAHSCGNGDKGCCNPHHLRWATPQENRDDTLIHGTRNRGERNGRAKLTESDIRAIRASQRSNSALADAFNVSKTTVFEVRNGKRWHHV